MVWLLTAVLAYRDARHEVDELLDAHLAQAATLLLAQIGHDDGESPGEIDTEHLRLPGKYGRRVLFQVWIDGRALGLHSLNAPNHRLSPREHGFDEVRIGDARWRVYSTWDEDHELLLQIAEDSRSRADIARSFGRSLLLPVVLGLPLLGVLITWSIGRGLRPLNLLSAAVDRRAPEHLAPIDVDDATPAELRPLVQRLNALLARLADSLERERRLTADATHELRTPIAALKVQAQVARDSASPAERDQALDKVLAGCDRAARLVEQLLDLAHLEPEHLQHRTVALAPGAIAAEVIAQLTPEALRRGIELELLDDPAARISGHPELLRVLLRNLIDNAIRHGAGRRTVTVGVHADGDIVLLDVSDQGPGVPEDLRDQLGQRFRRLGQTDLPGSGLGLSIVRRIAELHGAALCFDSGAGGRGLRVGLRFARVS